MKQWQLNLKHNRQKALTWAVPLYLRKWSLAKPCCLSTREKRELWIRPAFMSSCKNPVSSPWCQHVLCRERKTIVFTTSSIQHQKELRVTEAHSTAFPSQHARIPTAEKSMIVPQWNEKSHVRNTLLDNCLKKRKQEQNNKKFSSIFESKTNKTNNKWSIDTWILI